MIHLRPDCLVFELTSGEMIPCSAQEMALELIVQPGVELDGEVVKNAAAAVLHYFKSELGRSSVSVEEFSNALRRALQGLGIQVQGGTGSLSMSVALEENPAETLIEPSAPGMPEPVLDAIPPTPTLPVRRAQVDLLQVGRDAAGAGELQFYQTLRADLSQQLNLLPEVVVCTGLRACAKNLCSARRWSERCQAVSDQIVAYLRACLESQPGAGRCVLCIR